MRSKWINADKKLPEINVPVLVVDSYKVFYIAKYTAYNRWVDTYTHRFVDNIKYWTYIPDIPRKRH